MHFTRAPQFAAIALLVAAGLGLVLANSPLAAGAQAVKGTHLAIPFLGLDLSVGHWITDGLLAVFFFLAAVELKHELRHGELNSPARALVPAAAAIGGVAVPAIIFLVLVRQPGLSDGWPIPTATDIAFALGVLALVGKSLPARVRALLLALAVLDDLIAIVLIAVLFAHDLHPLALIGAIPLIAVFGLLSYRLRGRARPVILILMVVVAVAAWVLVTISGIHPTIAGVALGLALSSRAGVAARHAIEPYSNAFILPLFALTATLVTIPNLAATPLGPVFWAILIALPVGKIIGITAGAAIATALDGRPRGSGIPLPDILAVAALGGIGFTVSLLMNELAFASNHEAATEGTLGVLAASVVAMIVGGTLAALRSRHYARRPA